MVNNPNFELVKRYTDEEIKSTLIKQLVKALTLMNKYTVIPVYYIQCMVNKLSKQLYFILVAYDNKEFIIESANLNPHLKDVIYEKTPKTITPIAIVYPEEFNVKDLLYNVNELYYYSDLYICYGKDLKTILATDNVIIKNCEIYRNIKTNEIKTEIEWNWDWDKEGNFRDTSTKTISSKNLSLPLMQYANANAKTLSYIISEVASSSPVEIKDSSVIDTCIASVKDNQMDKTYTDPIFLFKDFMKQKPTVMRYWYKEVSNEDNTVKFMTVALDQYFKSSGHSSFIVYRYINDVITSLRGEA